MARLRGRALGLLVFHAGFWGVCSLTSAAFVPPPRCRSTRFPLAPTGPPALLLALHLAAGAAAAETTASPAPGGLAAPSFVGQALALVGVLAAAGAALHSGPGQAVTAARELLVQRPGGVPLWAFFGAMLVFSILGYQLDHMDGLEVGASAFFIDNKTRKLAPESIWDYTRFWLKIILLLVSLFIEYDLLFRPAGDRRQLDKRPPIREWLCLLCGAAFIARILLQMGFFWHREISWIEVFAEAGGVIPISLASFAFGAARRRGAPVGATEIVGVLVFLLGTYLNIWPEYTRYVWKSDPANAGHLYTEGLFAVCRHINYFGEVLSFVGFALASSAWGNLWVPAVMGIGMAGFSVPELDAYLSTKYAAEWAAYAREVTCQMFPFVW